MRKNRNFKKLMIFAITALMVFSGITLVANAAHVEIGTGVLTSYYMPAYGLYDYSWSEKLLLASEIGSTLSISGLSFNAKGGTLPYTYYNQKVYMTHTTLTQFPDGNKPDSSTMTLVYEGDYTVSALGWNAVSLDTAFTYNGVDNLLIYWENWDGDYTTGYASWQSTTTSPNYCEVYCYQDTTFPTTKVGTRTYTRSNIRLIYQVDHDVAAIDIVSPELIELAGSIPVQVEVKNTGLNTETFPVNVKIDYIGKPKAVFEQDFTGVPTSTVPAGWYTNNIAHWYVYASTMPGGVSPCMRYYYYPYTGLLPNTYTVQTPAIDTTGHTSLDLSFKHYIDHSSVTTPPYQLKLQTSTDNSTWTDVYVISPTVDIGPETKTFTLTTAEGVGSSTLIIRWMYTTGATTYGCLYWYIDNILLKYMGTPPANVYDQTVTVSNLGVGASTIANLPNWVVSTSGSYVVTATTQLGTDMDATNNQISQITEVGLVDAALVSIDVPHPLMGPAPFEPKATVTNLGDYAFISTTVGKLPVHATIPDPSGGTGIVYSEDFEGAVGFYEFEGRTEVSYNPDNIWWKSGDVVGAPGMIIWPEDQPSFGAPSDWTKLDSDSDGTTWHPTTYRSSPSSPVQSMYHGDETTKLYNPYSWDIMISPQIYVGPVGGSFGFDIYNDVEAGYDYAVFGASPDGITFSWWWFGASYWQTWMSASGIPISSTDVDANGFCYIAFGFSSDNIVNYEGVYIDNIEVIGSPMLYDETVLVDLPAGQTLQVTFPEFTPLEAYHSYTITVCCEASLDGLSSNDCASLAFINNAPVYNERTGYGYNGIQEAIDSPDTIDGDAIHVNAGNFYEDLIINKELTVSGLTPADCDGGSTYLFGTVDIVADNVIFENFYVHPLTLFTTDEAAIAIYSNNVIVRHNGVEIMGETSGTIKGIHAYATPSGYTQNIEISDNCVHDVINTLGCSSGGGGGGDILYFNNFESNNGGWAPSASWSPYIGDWQWTNTYNVANYVYGSYATSEKPPTSAYSGTGLWGTILYAPYTNAGGSSYLTQTFDFSGWTDMQIKWRSWEQVFGNFDYCQLKVNGNLVWGPSWDYSAPVWQERIVDLSAYDGLSSVTIQFEMYATTVVNYAGWYIDDIEINGDDGQGGPVGNYGGAVGIMDQGATWNVDILNNTVYDVHSPGWANGIEITPTAVDPELIHFNAYLNFAEDFTGIATGAIPTGWSRTDTHWGAVASANAGGVSPEMRFYWSPSATSDFYLKTPEIDTSAFSTLTLSYRHMVNHFTTPYTLKLVTIAGGTEYTIATWSPTASIPAALLTYTLTAAQGVGASDFQIAWVFSGYSYNINYWYIDNVVLSGSYDYWATVNPWPLDVTVEGNILKLINLGPGYPCPDVAPAYPGIMLNINYANLPTYGPTPADASEVIARHNWFDMDCYVPALAILNTDLMHCLDATDNYYSQPDGPGSFDPLGGTAMVVDCMTGEVADGLGSSIVVYGPVHFDPYLGLNAEHNIVSPYNAEVGETIVFDGSASYANDFDGISEPIFFWNFDDGFYSMQESISHTYNSPGTYNGYLRVHMLGIPELGIPPLYEWDYFTIIVGGAGSPLSANADGGSLGGYEVSQGSPIRLSGIASGGEAPYTYQWTLGDGRTVEGQNPTVVYWLDEENPLTTTYTITLTVVDANYDTASDTATVTVLAPDQLNVIINAPANANSGLPLKFTSTVTGGETPYTYEWDFGDGTPINIAANPVHVFEHSATYTVTVTVTDNAGTVKTATKTITLEAAESTSAEIKEVKGGFRVTATIAAGDSDCHWTINVEGNFVLSGGEADGIIDANSEETVRLPLTFAFGKVDITVTADSIQKQYSAFALGPLFLNVQEA